ncbi:MAG: UDP-N-acetylglucosamine--N-acetylmuramyl-(pentapeptide) pyrophosphoryl-undecaprenol N-acetylglucosamine transferase, partial [Myxococcaceae bacterium]
FDPDIVIGVGGYASGPVLLAAWFLRIQRVICEQNAVPGFTNRILGKYFVKHIFGAFSKCGTYFTQDRYLLLGNPLRASFSNPPSREPKGVLILGGSLGARPLNNTLPAALAIVKTSVPDLKITHQTGQAECEAVKASYQELGLEALVTPFIEDMPLAYSRAQLVIARSGAMACSELAAMGVPSILIPFPQAIDDHQTENAKELVQAGAAILMPQDKITAASLAGLIGHLLLDLKSLENMAHRAHKVGKPNAADRVAQKVIELC